MKKNLKIFSVFGTIFVAFSLFSEPASAQTLGGLMSNLFSSTDEIPGLFTGLSYLFGLILGVMGIWKLREHVETPNQTQIWDPLKRFLAGGAFFSLPLIVAVVQETVTGGNGDALSANGDYNTSGVSGGGLDAMIVSLMADIWGPTQLILLGFCYLAGIILVMIGISRLLKSEQDGPRGPLGLGTIMTFLIAGILLSIDKILSFANNSIFSGNVSASATLSYGGSGAEIGHAEAVIGAILAFVAIIGFISFIRGFFIVRQVAEGNSQASMMAALTHIIGGSLAVNLGGVIQAVQTTLGITNYGLTF